MCVCIPLCVCVLCCARAWQTWSLIGGSKSSIDAPLLRLRSGLLIPIARGIRRRAFGSRGSSTFLTDSDMSSIVLLDMRPALANPGGVSCDAIGMAADGRGVGHRWRHPPPIDAPPTV